MHQQLQLAVKYEQIIETQMSLQTPVGIRERQGIVTL
jgi:hypothetical protein